MRLGRTIVGLCGALGLLGALNALTLSGSAAVPTKTTPPKKASPNPRAIPQIIYKREQYDSLVSVNDHCPVRHGRLNSTIRPVYVNRQPVGFC